MLETRIFLLTLTVAFGVLIVAQMPPLGNPFTDGGQYLRERLDTMPAAHVAELKYRHGARVEKFDMGLFGNSHAIQITATDLRISDQTFFNFAIPGTSFRQSVTLLEALEATGKAPRTALISFDNAALQYFSNAEWPVMPQRWGRVFQDIRYGLAESAVSTREFLRIVNRHVWTDWQFVTRLFNFERLKISLGATPNNVSSEYRDDGSRGEQPTDKFKEIEPLPPQVPAVLENYLAFDLARLARIQEHGTKIIVYESPMAPGSYVRAPVIDRTRAAFLKNCKILELDCIAAPQLGTPGRAPFWQDSNHAPAALLGVWLSERLEERKLISR